jgi:pyruvate kinase
MSIPPIIATLGTTTDDPTVLAGMEAAGMGMARLNTAYTNVARVAARITALRAATSAAVLLDLKGAQLRVECTTEKPDPETGMMVERPCRYPVKNDDLVRVGFRVGPVRFNHYFAEDIALGDTVLFANGTIRAEVVDPSSEGIKAVPHTVLLRIHDAGAGHMTPFMSANVPDHVLGLPCLTDKDRSMAQMGVDLGVEAYALSFVRHAEDIQQLHQLLAGLGDTSSTLIAKIEEPLGIAALPAIIKTAKRCRRPFAVMVARGDLFVECPPEQLPSLQRALVSQCKKARVPVIVATGLLQSMTKNPQPTRSEVCDVANAIRDGADSLMLSDETSNSKYPIDAVHMLTALWNDLA